MATTQTLARILAEIQATNEQNARLLGDLHDHGVSLQSLPEHADYLEAVAALAVAGVDDNHPHASGRPKALTTAYRLSRQANQALRARLG